MLSTPDSRSLILHPGRSFEPVCEDCEANFRVALARKEVHQKSILLIAATLEPEERRISVQRQTVPALVKTFIQPNGLILEGSYKGFWAHQVDERRWLLARPNRDLTLPPQPEPSLIPHHFDLRIWKGVLVTLKRNLPPSVTTSISGFTFNE